MIWPAQPQPEAEVAMKSKLGEIHDVAVVIDAGGRATNARAARFGETDHGKLAIRRQRNA